jgi:hypothetical protein
MSCQDYFEQARNIVEVIKSIEGSLVDDMHLSDELPPTQPIGGYTDDQYAAARERILNKKIAYGILVRADRGRYGKLIEEVENAYLKGNNHYPTTPTESYNLLVNYKNYSSNKRTISQGGLEQVAFVTKGKKLKKGKEFPHIKCFKCGKFGHYKSDCAKSDNGKEVSQEVCQVIQATTLMTQAKSVNGRQGIDPMWILCDNESTVDIIKNKAMVTNIRTTNNPVEITGIGGMPIRVYQVGDLLGYGTVYYHPDITANIISFNHLVKRFKPVKYDNNVKDAFIITGDDNSTMEFVPSTDGLYHYDFNLSIKRRLELEKKQKAKTMVTQTVEGIKRNFTKKEQEQVDKARQLYVTVGRPSQKIFEDMLRKGKLVNTNITFQDYRNAIEIYGKDLGDIKGKTTRKKPSQMQIITFDKPSPKNLILSIDIMFFYWFDISDYC